MGEPRPDSKARIIKISPAEVSPIPINWLHPLDEERSRNFLSSRLPVDLYNRLASSPRPQSSPNADSNEREEVEQVKRRRLGGSGEVGSWLLKTLYEESFAVKPVMAVGGVISHFNQENRIVYIYPEKKLVRVVPNDVLVIINKKFPNFERFDIDQAFVSLAGLTETGQLSLDELATIVNGAYAFGTPVNSPRWADRVRARIDQRVYPRFEENPAMIARFPGHEPEVRQGWEFLRTYQRFASELGKPVKDARLKAEFPEVHMEVAIDAIVGAWKALYSRGGLVFHDKGGFRFSGDEGFDEGLRKLAVVRSSEDLAFLYDHFCVRGAL